METPRPADAIESSAPWLADRLLPDARFARAYNALGDARRALLKSRIADHYALLPPRPDLRAELAELLPGGLALRQTDRPRPFVVILADAALDAPAFLLAALMPALCSGAGSVLVARLGSRAAVPDALLTACELAGQERVAALGPGQAARLMADLASSGAPGLVLHPDTQDLRTLLRKPSVAAALHDSPLRLSPLRLPSRPALWRDEPGQFDPRRVEFLYGQLAFEAGSGAGFEAFASTRRDLLLLPDARAGQPTAASLAVAEAYAGLWLWPDLTRAAFSLVTRSVAPGDAASAPLA